MRVSITPFFALLLSFFAPLLLRSFHVVLCGCRCMPPLCWRHFMLSKKCWMKASWAYYDHSLYLDECARCCVIVQFSFPPLYDLLSSKGAHVLRLSLKGYGTTTKTRRESPGHTNLGNFLDDSVRFKQGNLKIDYVLYSFCHSIYSKRKQMWCLWTSKYIPTVSSIIKTFGHFSAVHSLKKTTVANNIILFEIYWWNCFVIIYTYKL